MGIPSYFVHIVKNHRNIIKLFKKNVIGIDNLYIDSNSIIYDALRTIEYKNKESFEKKLINMVCDKIKYYIDLIGPTQRVLVAYSSNYAGDRFYGKFVFGSINIFYKIK